MAPSAVRAAVKIGDIEVLAVRDGVGTEVAVDILSVGPFDDGKYRGGRLLDSLVEAGVSPGDVTDVVFTHLHFDHIGWASVDDKPMFPRATCRAHRADWEHFVSGEHADPAAVAELTPLADGDRLELFDGDFTLAPGIDALHLPGHTPGTTVYVVSVAGRRVLLGDVAHSLVQFSERDWQVIWDVDPAAASAVRNRIADEAADTDDLLVAAHFRDMRLACRLTPEGYQGSDAVSEPG
ncbi:glyoxylase-like metal-dependent hydrolase (beta-lactamase superfamily II) [Catenulispora sp. EB89]|uniref:MBL fold metallo-hydrolase n=1 Tax=Catenulispora sp. EB89 TaxID=3156257 RepID=UPI0035148E03